MRAQFDAAKRWWAVAIICQLTVVAIGIISMFTNILVTWLGLLAAMLTIAYVFSQWQSDQLRNTADAILRKLELHDGLAWPITSREIADLLLTVPKSVKAKSGVPDTKDYFDSATSKSPLRVLENLDESTWMTRHQTQRMAQYVFWLSISVFAVAFIALITTIQNAVTQTVANNIAQITITVIVFMFSGGYVRLAFSYHQLAMQTEKIGEESHRLIKETGVSDIQAAKLLHDYQIIRAKAPMLPNWLWQRMEQELNELWQQHQRVRDEALNESIG